MITKTIAGSIRDVFDKLAILGIWNHGFGMCVYAPTVPPSRALRTLSDGIPGVLKAGLGRCWRRIQWLYSTLKGGSTADSLKRFALSAMIA